MSEIVQAPPAIAIAAPLREKLRRLFDSPVNALITVLFALFAVLFVLPLLRWAFIDATWSGTRATCEAAASGACWVFIGEKMNFILFAFYPQEHLGQAATAVAIILGLIIVSALPRFWHPRLVIVWIAGLTLAVGIMTGQLTGATVPTQKWGGFPVTLLLAVAGFVGAFPLGILLAFGRRSQMALVQVLSVAFIELMRGVPMIAVLYVSTLLFPLMLPAGSDIDKLLRAQVAIILFISAYMAEIVRAGLQSVPRAQEEAAASLGLSWGQTMALVVLPQALRSVIPSFVNLGIGIFLDTTLVIVIGLFDFLNTARVAAADPAWLGYYNEAFAFTALIYFAFCLAGSRYSKWLEVKLRAARSRF